MNIKAEKQNMRERAEQINEKHKRNDSQVSKLEKMKHIESMKHRELENLKFQDLAENKDM